jgi:hypothetical protein
MKIILEKRWKQTNSSEIFFYIPRSMVGTDSIPMLTDAEDWRHQGHAYSVVGVYCVFWTLDTSSLYSPLLWSRNGIHEPSTGLILSFFFSFSLPSFIYLFIYFDCDFF